MEIKNVLICGLGAIGSIYATKIKNANLKILLDESRIERYQRDGLYFNNQRYDFSYILPSENNFKADLIIIATKSTGFLSAIKGLENFITEKTIILSLLNGIRSEDILKEHYSNTKVLYSYYVGHASMKTQNKVFYDGIGNIVFGEINNEKLSDDVLALKNFFDKEKIDYIIPKDMLSSMWKKFIINLGLNQTTALFQAPYGIFKVEYARKIAQNLMQEGVILAQKVGAKGNFIEDAFKLIDEMPPEYKTSMEQDVEQGRKTEVDIFAGEVCNLGKKYGISTPYNEFLYNYIKGKESSTWLKVIFGLHLRKDK